MSFQKRQAYYTKALNNQQRPITNDFEFKDLNQVETYIQSGPLKPLSPNFGSIHWSNTTSPRRTQVKIII